MCASPPAYRRPRASAVAFALATAGILALGAATSAGADGGPEREPAPAPPQAKKGGLARFFAGGEDLPPPDVDPDRVHDVSEVRFIGNRRTREAILRQELPYAPGGPVDEAHIEAGRRAILDLGLFEAVTWRVDPGPEGAIVVYTVDEKVFFWVLPKVDRSGDGDITLGVQSEFSNLFGRNQTLDIVVSRKDYEDAADIDVEKELELDWSYPRVGGGPYNVTVGLAGEESELDETRGALAGRFLRDRRSIFGSASRWVHLTGPSRGWRVGAGIRLDDYDHEYLEGDPTLFFDSTVLSFSTFVEYRDLRDRVFSRSGTNFAFSVEFASDDFGSDDSFLRNELFYTHLIPLDFREHTNLNYRFAFGWATESIFGDPTFSLGGSDTLRGYGRDVTEGDAYLLANVEFLVPFSERRPAWRAALFFDAGNTYPKVDDVDPTDQRMVAGAGLRWTIRRLVRIQLRLDVGRGLNRDGETKVYAASRATF